VTRSLAGVPLSEFHASNNIMVYSPPGHGKTAFGSSWPKTLIWNCEPGIVTAKRVGNPNVRAINIRTWSDAWEYLLAAEDGHTGGHEWYNVDTISTLENKAMRQVLDEMVDRNPKRDPDLPDRAEHQLRQNRLKRFVERMVDLPVNILWLAHEMRVENESGGIDVMPSISGGADKGYPVANYIMGLMNAVGYLRVTQVPEGSEEAEEEPAEEDNEEEGSRRRKGRKRPKPVPMREVQRILWTPYTDTEKDITYTAKNQYGFPSWTDDWSMVDLVEAIEKGLPTVEPAEVPDEPARPVKRARRAPR
jgi:AAA domain